MMLKNSFPKVLTYVIMALSLAGCETVFDSETPVDLTCEATCENADVCELRCRGIGRTQSRESTEVGVGR